MTDKQTTSTIAFGTGPSLVVLGPNARDGQLPDPQSPADFQLLCRNGVNIAVVEAEEVARAMRTRLSDPREADAAGNLCAEALKFIQSQQKNSPAR
jgi:hypothetical protein